MDNKYRKTHITYYTIISAHLSALSTMYDESLSVRVKNTALTISVKTSNQTKKKKPVTFLFF